MQLVVQFAFDCAGEAEAIVAVRLVVVFGLWNPAMAL